MLNRGLLLPNADICGSDRSRLLAERFNVVSSLSKKELLAPSKSVGLELTVVWKVLTFKNGLPVSLRKRVSSVGVTPRLVSWLNVWRLRVLRPRLFFRSTARDLLNELPIIWSEDWSILRGSTTLRLGSSTFLFSLLCSGWGSKDEHPLVDSEFESSSPVRMFEIVSK